MAKLFTQKRLTHGAVALGVLVLLTGAGLWLLSRESTLVSAANFVVRQFEGKLKLTDVSGSLLSTIRARELDYEAEFGRLEIRDAVFEWRPIRLLRGQVAVGSMRAVTVGLQLAKSKDEPATPPASLRSPLSFAITDFDVGTLTIARPDAATQEVRGIRAAFSGNKRHLQAELKSLATQWGNARGKLKVGGDNPFPLEGRLELAAPDPQRYSVAADFGGTLMNAEAKLDAKALDATAAAKLAVAPFDPRPLTRLEFSAQNIDPRAWAPTAPGAKLSGEGELVADAERTLKGSFAFKNSEPGNLDDKKLPFAELSSILQGDLDNLALSDVKLDLAQAGQFAGSGAWRDGAVEVVLDTRNLDLRGAKKTLHPTRLAGRLALGADANGQRARVDLAQQAYRFKVAAVIADGIATVQEAYARAGGAELTARGKIALNEQKPFEVRGRLANFDPSKFGNYPNHLINGRFELKGQIDPVLQVAANVNVTDSRLNGLPASATGTFRSRRLDDPDIAMDVALRVGATRASAKGTIRDPGEKRSIDMQLSLAGASLAELYKIVGVPLPPTPPYKIEGRLLQRGEVWEFRQFAGGVGSSDLSGTFVVDRGRSPQFMKADLTSKRLDLADLHGFIGAEKTAPGKVAAPRPGRVLPDSPYNLEKLKAADADIRFEGRQVLTEKLPVQNMSTRLVVKDGVLTLSPLNFGVAGGNLVSDITLDGRGSVIASRADIRVQSLQLEQLLPKLKISKASVGELDGRVRLTARGNSVAAMLGTANGDTVLVVGEGEVSDLIMRLSNLDVANTLGVLVRGDRNIPIRCMVADVAFENGVMQPRQLVLDTAHTTLVGEGSANFANETLDLRVAAKPKGPSILSLRGPIVVSGTFADPSVLPDLKRLTARGAAAVALGIVNPIAAIAPFLQLGNAKNGVQCGPLVEATKRAIAKPSTHVATR